MEARRLQQARNPDQLRVSPVFGLQLGSRSSYSSAELYQGKSRVPGPWLCPAPAVPWPLWRCWLRPRPCVACKPACATSRKRYTPTAQPQGPRGRARRTVCRALTGCNLQVAVFSSHKACSKCPRKHHNRSQTQTCIVSHATTLHYYNIQERHTRSRHVVRESTQSSLTRQRRHKTHRQNRRQYLHPAQALSPRASL